MFRKLFWILVLMSIFSTGCGTKNGKGDLYDNITKKNNIVVGISYNSKPFGFKDSDGQIKGMEADLAREIAKRILGDSSKVTFKDVTPQDRINAVTSDYVDMVISTMTINPQRKKLVYFSTPYFVAGQAICVKKNSKILSYTDLNNKKVVVILGTTGEKNIKKFAPNALVQGYNDNADAIDAFINGGDDAITTDDSLLMGLVMGNSNYILLPERLTKEPYGIAIKKSKQSNVFKKKIDSIINDIKYDGTLDAIANKWNVYNN